VLQAPAPQASDLGPDFRFMRLLGPALGHDPREFSGVESDAAPSESDKWHSPTAEKNFEETLRDTEPTGAFGFRYERRRRLMVRARIFGYVRHYDEHR
jgi:hypothetical protein